MDLYEKEELKDKLLRAIGKECLFYAEPVRNYPQGSLLDMYNSLVELGDRLRIGVRIGVENQDLVIDEIARTHSRLLNIVTTKDTSRLVRDLTMLVIDKILAIEKQ